MKYLFPVSLSVLLAGCIAPRDPNLLSKEEWVRQEYTYEFDSWHSLHSFTSQQNRPEKEVAVEHDGRGLKVIQVIPTKLNDKTWVNRVLVVEADPNGRMSLGGLVLSILTKQEYVDDEYLTPGFYTYIGPYTYQTKGNDVKTVREFADLSQGPVAAKDRRRRVPVPATSEVK